MREYLNYTGETETDFTAELAEDSQRDQRRSGGGALSVRKNPPFANSAKDGAPSSSNVERF
jgi:hypothetical protein